MIRKILIANRGEIAIRIIHEVHFTFRAGSDGGVGVFHRIEPDAGAGGILFPDKIHHFSVHTHIPPIVMSCLGVF